MHYLLLSLAVTVLEEIVLLLTRRQKLTDAKILEQIITPLIQHLSFSLYCDDYLILFPKFGNLLTLDLKKTIVGNNSLKSIATYCFKLRYNNLSFSIYSFESCGNREFIT